jgi:hypothetical protein
MMTKAARAVVLDMIAYVDEKIATLTVLQEREPNIAIAVGFRNGQIAELRATRWKLECYLDSRERPGG